MKHVFPKLFYFALLFAGFLLGCGGGGGGGSPASDSDDGARDLSPSPTANILVSSESLKEGDDLTLNVELQNFSDAARYSWTVQEIDNQNGAQPILLFENLDQSQPQPQGPIALPANTYNGNYSVTLVVTDTDNRYTVTSNFSVATNQPPTNVDAGPNQLIEAGGSVALNAAVTAAADDPGLTTQWEVVSEPQGASVSFANASDLQQNVQIFKAGHYVFRFSVSDGFHTITDDISVSTYGVSNCRATNVNSDGTYAPESQIQWDVVVRDFLVDHEDMNRGNTSTLIEGLVEPGLGFARLPILTAKGADISQTNKAIESADTFNQWYRDVTGINQRVQTSLTLEVIDPSEVIRSPRTRVWTYADGFFFPINGQGFGTNDFSQGGIDYNNYFTLTSQLDFQYHRGQDQRIAARGDDDFWVFIDGQLVIDGGGTHGAVSITFDLNEEDNGVTNAQTLGLTDGEEFTLDIFYAQRRADGAVFVFETTMDPICDLVGQ